MKQDLIDKEIRLTSTGFFKKMFTYKKCSEIHEPNSEGQIRK